MFNKKNLIITGGTGSFGKAFVEYVLKNFKPNKVVIYSRDELKQYHFAENLKSKGFDQKRIRFFIGDVRDKSRLSLAFQTMDFVIHAAALKQIVSAEYNPQEVIQTNIKGAENVIFASLEQNVKKIIALSTDKAVNPVNLYGATKLVADKLFINANNLSGKKECRFSVVRYGNVINSRGSVIPFFKRNLKEKKFFPITNREMTRFFIDLKEGVKFVIKSFSRMHGGEIFIPKINSIRIIDIAKSMNSNAKIKIIGIRPGEKIHEVLCPQDESHLTLEFKDHFIIKPTIGLEIKNNYNLNKIGEKGKKVKQNFEYISSKNTFLKINEIKAILEKLNTNTL